MDGGMDGGRDGGDGRIGIRMHEYTDGGHNGFVMFFVIHCAPNSEPSEVLTICKHYTKDSAI